MGEREISLITEHALGWLKNFQGRKVYLKDIGPGLGIHRVSNKDFDTIADDIVNSDKKKYIRGETSGDIWVQVNPSQVKLNWWDRHPVARKWRDGFITFLFSIVGAIVLYLILPQKVGQGNNQQIERLNILSDSIKNLQKRIDTLK